jgi:N4-gp56 family major capsid protein
MTVAATTQASTGFNTGGAVVPPYYTDFMRQNLWPSLYFRQLGTLITIPKGTGDKVKIPRWQSPLSTSRGVTTINGANTAIKQLPNGTGEGDTGAWSLKGFSADFISGNIAQMIGGRSYSDKLILVTKANFVEGALESLVRELAFRLDRYTRRNITANALQKYAKNPGGSGSLAKTTDALFGKNIARIEPLMLGGNVPAWEDQTFICITNPYAKYDIYRDTSANGFVSVYRYNNVSNIFRGEVGLMYDIRLIVTTAIPIIRGGASNSKMVSAKNTGCNALVMGPDAFFSLEIEDGGVEVIHHPPGSSGSVGDPGNQIGSIVVKVWYGIMQQPSADGRVMIFGHGLGLKG